MKAYANYVLARWPRLYLAVLRALRSQHVEKSTFLRLVRNGDTVFDVGANRGVYTLLFSHLVGRHGQVHAFEPVRSTLEQLSARLSREQRHPNVTVNAMALGDREISTVMHLPAGDDGQASLRRHSAGSWEQNISERIPCSMATLDRYVDDAGLGHIDFIKMDVEGAELLALRGGLETLNRFQPVLHMEYCRQWTVDFDYGAVELLSLLRGAGYRHFYLGDLTRLEDAESELASSTHSENVVCSVEPLSA